MQNAVHNGSGRREDRVPLEAFIELCSEGSAEPLEADGLNVSMGGLGVRAAFVPPLGALMECRFSCPPDGELVSALGEVTWSERTGPEEGQFGLRFLELDTKSATSLRRFVRPGSGPDAPQDRLRAASLAIDGLGATVEADLKLADETRVVLEQQLTFLQLGRGVEVSVLGRGKERGRIASVELRHTNFDVPTLVFGILLDEAPERERAAVAPGVTSLFSGPPVESEAPRAAWAREVATQDASASSEPSEWSPVAEDGVGAEPEDELALPGLRPGTRALAERVQGWLAAIRAGAASLRARLAPRLREQADYLELPDLKTRLLVHVARLRAVALRSWSRLRRPGARRERSRLPPPLRVQRSTLVPGGGEGGLAPALRPARIAAGLLACAGIAGGVYALAPRSGADRLRVPAPAEQAETEEDLELEPGLGEAEPDVELASDGEGEAQPPELGARAQGRRERPSQQAAEIEAAPVPVLSAPFGEPDVPNGRTFSLRMNGPVASVEGEEREDGFTVRIPRRLALDRASPIASSHRAVARAMILNRGSYAELTIDFLPGRKPRYQVVGRDNMLEITLERL